MTNNIGTKYDEIAQWWHERHERSDYGVAQVQKALDFTKRGGRVLDVGCGAGGRFVSLYHQHEHKVLGIDASAKMIELAKNNHPQDRFVQKDIRQWQSLEQFDIIVAWDSLFHLPFEAHYPVLKMLCERLSKSGIFIYTFGDAVGSHEDSWQGQMFQYSSIGINKNLECLMENGLKILHLELDQQPENHVYVIAQKA